MVQITDANLDAADFVALIAAHKTLMLAHSPPESSHALLIDGLKASDISVFEMRDDGALIGCGALKALSAIQGEIKSMHTIAARRGEGLGQRMLDHLIAVARQRGYQRLSLETGAMAGFLPARRLYEGNGFAYCGPFADYTKDPNSVFMTRQLSSAGEPA